MYRVFVANLLDYYNGSVNGEEISLPINKEDLRKVKCKLLKTGTEDLVVLHANDLGLASYYDIEDINDLLLYANSKGLLEDAVALLNYDLGILLGDIRKHLDNKSYEIIKADSLEEYGKELVRLNLVKSSKVLGNFIDYNGLGSDYIISNNVTVQDGIFIKLS